jgi:DNA-binding transcriptional ArsR family regulator
MSRKRPTDLFQALADPTRLAIFERLLRGESSVSLLVQSFSVSQPAVSQHLGVLRRCRLVAFRREGRNIIYQAQPEGLEPLINWFEYYRKFWPDRIQKLRSVLKEQRSE